MPCDLAPEIALRFSGNGFVAPAFLGSSTWIP